MCIRDSQRDADPGISYREQRGVPPETWLRGALDISPADFFAQSAQVISDKQRFAGIGDGVETIGRIVPTSESTFEMTDVRSHRLTVSADSMNLPHHIAVGAT